MDIDELEEAPYQQHGTRDDITEHLSINDDVDGGVRLPNGYSNSSYGKESMDGDGQEVSVMFVAEQEDAADTAPSSRSTTPRARKSSPSNASKLFAPPGLFGTRSATPLDPQATPWLPVSHFLPGIEAYADEQHSNHASSSPPDDSASTTTETITIYHAQNPPPLPLTHHLTSPHQPLLFPRILSSTAWHSPFLMDSCIATPTLSSLLSTATADQATILWSTFLNSNAFLLAGPGSGRNGAAANMLHWLSRGPPNRRNHVSRLIFTNFFSYDWVRTATAKYRPIALMEACPNLRHVRLDFRIRNVPGWARGWRSRGRGQEGYVDEAMMRAMFEARYRMSDIFATSWQSVESLVLVGWADRDMLGDGDGYAWELDMMWSLRQVGWYFEEQLVRRGRSGWEAADVVSIRIEIEREEIGDGDEENCGIFC